MKSELRALLSHHLNERELTQADEALSILNSESPSEEAYYGALCSLDDVVEYAITQAYQEACSNLYSRIDHVVTCAKQMKSAIENGKWETTF